MDFHRCAFNELEGFTAKMKCSHPASAVLPRGEKRHSETLLLLQMGNLGRLRQGVYVGLSCHRVLASLKGNVAPG